MQLKYIYNDMYYIKKYIQSFKKEQQMNDIIKALSIYIVPTFSYGFYKSITAETRLNEKSVNKLYSAINNGIMYTNPLTLKDKIQYMLVRKLIT